MLSCMVVSGSFPAAALPWSCLRDWPGEGFRGLGSWSSQLNQMSFRWSCLLQEMDELSGQGRASLLFLRRLRCIAPWRMVEILSQPLTNSSIIVAIDVSSPAAGGLFRDIVQILYCFLLWLNHRFHFWFR